MLPGEAASYARGINNLGQIVGAGAGILGTPFSFGWVYTDAGGLVDLYGRYNWFATPSDINDNGVILAETQTFDLATSTVTDVGLSGPTNYNAIGGVAINNAGQILGSASLRSSSLNIISVFRYVPGTGWEFISGSSRYTAGYDINSLGDIGWGEQGAGISFEGLGKYALGNWKRAEISVNTVVTPEIAVEQSATNIPDAGTHDFGSAIMGVGAPLTFVIKNTGSANLTGLTITKNGTNSGDFAITSSPVAPLSGPSGSTTFRVVFTPAAVGARAAAIHIASNDSDEAPFDIQLTGTGITALQSRASTAGLPPGQDGPGHSPQNDGVGNLEKFAFNLNPMAADVRRLTVGANQNAGLPGAALINGKLRLEFIRRKVATHPGIAYIPQFAPTIGAWVDVPGDLPGTSMDSKWERVVVDDPAPGAGAARFGRLKVVQIP